MPFCGNCGHPLSDTDLTCPNCGEIRPNAIPKPDSINQEPTAPTPDTPIEPNLNPEQSNSNATAQSADTAVAPEIPREVSQPDNYDHVTAYQNNTQADAPVANDIPREVPQPNTSATQNTTAETNAAPDFSAYDIRNNIPNGNTANQQQPNFSGQSYQQSTAGQSPYTYNDTYSTPNTPLTNDKSNGLGIASLILGICSIAICCCYGVGAIPAIIGLILGILQNKKNANGIATAGIVLGIIGILLNVVWLIYMIIFLSEDGLQDFVNEFSSNYEYYEDSTL
ncbi:MAG: zinc-ribbon domain-containing protein [Ruminococcus sp.]|nr:zinc-ribbon domain-containing protein [Ruminococcus sp.]